MSHIDSYRHEIVGLFGSLPVYHPLEDILASETGIAEDFGCTTGQLVMGGGSGEHPGVVLLDPQSAVAQFVYESGDFDLSDVQRSHLSDLIGLPPRFNFVGWSTEDHHWFYEHCVSCALPNRFDPDDETSLEDWLHLGFGEFVYYAMPQLSARLVDTFRPQQLDASRIRYSNITAIPPGMPVYANGGNAFFK